MSSVEIGIVGLPNVGKSTLFNALSGSTVLAANYPFATIEPNIGIVQVPDERLQRLAELYKTDKIVPATITFVDIAGLVEGASHGEGLGNQFLSHIRSTNAIIHIVRAFEDPNIIRSTSQSTPKQDIDIVNTELVLADLQTVDKRLARLQKEAKADPKLQPNVNELMSGKTILETGTPLFASPLIQSASTWLRQETQLLTLKPIIYVFNVDEQSLTNTTTQQKLMEIVFPAQALFINAELESELHSLEAAEAQELLESYGVHESGLVQLVHAAYNLLGLQSYLTAGQKEVRAWTIHRGATAPDAAGVIHSDFRRGFIAAQVINYRDLIDAGSEIAARSAGKIRTEGKDYVMQPDDVVEFRFNV